ncbi:MAG: hypothetical protein K2L24_03990 [Opitutales bacterium]|nr:hypothetical protein [Opitutales bacterium]
MKHLIFSLFLSLSPLYGDDFFDANDAIERQEYAEAIEHLNAIPTYSFAKYFNLGSAYLQQGDEVNARISFERARNMAPYRSALDAAYQALPKASEQGPLMPLLATKFYADVAVGTLLVLFIFFSFLVIRRRSKFGYVLLWLLSASFAGYGYYLKQAQRQCVIIRNEAPLRVSPTSQASVLMFLERGKPITALERHSDFLLAKLPQGKNGWIAVDDVAFILPPQE